MRLPAFRCSSGVLRRPPLTSSFPARATRRASAPNGTATVAANGDNLIRALSSLRPQLDKNDGAPNYRDGRKSSEARNPELPKFNLQSLGLSRNMRLVVLGLVSVFGTIETWFWFEAFVRWRKGGGEGEQGGRE
ncbi:hypothetical protein MKZ38_003549 [Zalerion maritima]|uniref:Uncharacterized protein n=1 Tax=Zalerion maritima TaxID=339359 RepID=A0AAD5WQ73_9PEZI|nr:hypothetical protein MKZ38_003549 [Zalerion maritima]